MSKGVQESFDNSIIDMDGAWPWWIEEEDKAEAKKWWDNLVWQRVCHTEDMLELNRVDWHLVFVYDSLKSHYANHTQWMQHAEFVCSARTVRPCWRMYEMKEDPRTCTILRTTDKDEKAAHVYGELWAVPLGTLTGLDIFNCNGGSYDREKIAIRLLYPYLGFSVFAWIYGGRELYFSEKVENTEKWKPSQKYTAKKDGQSYWFYRRGKW